MCEELSYQIIHTSAVDQAVFCSFEYCKNHYRKENISVDGGKQGRERLG